MFVVSSLLSDAALLGLISRTDRFFDPCLQIHVAGSRYSPRSYLHILFPQSHKPLRALDLQSTAGISPKY
jgi:hypothetical protein